MTNPDVERTITERLLPDVIHKIKNSLGGIGGFAALLERDLEPESGSRRLVVRIEEGVEKINTLAVDLMILVRDLDFNPEVVRLSDFIHMLQDTTEPGESMYALRRATSIPESAMINIDSNLFGKLIHYVMRYLSFIGKIEEIRFHEIGGTVNMTFICDNGCVDDAVESTRDFLHNSDPIEARLCLANALKLSDLHRGKCEISVNKGRRNLTIGL